MGSRSAAALLAVTAAALAGAGPSPLLGQEWKEFRSARQAAPWESLEVELLYGAGRLSVSPSESGYLYDARIRYDASEFAPLRNWTTSDGRAQLRLAVTSAGSADRELPEIRLDDFNLDFDLDGLRKLGDSAGRFDLRLTPSVPTSLVMHVGAAESTLEMGGLHLTRLELNTGASETRLSFQRPNAGEMERLTLKVGAAEFRGAQLGNANFREFVFEGGVGDVVLDLTGEWRGSASARVKMGVGALILRLPRELAVRVRKKSFLTAFDASGFERAGEAWQTANWNEAPHRLELELEAAFGAVDIERVP